MGGREGETLLRDRVGWMEVAWMFGVLGLLDGFAAGEFDDRSYIAS